MKTLAIIALMAGTATVGAAGLAAAQPHHGGMANMMERLDTNGDGQITKEEAEAAKAARFPEADTNGDGGLSMAEMQAFRAAEKARRMETMRQRMFDKADADGNGVISADEFEARGAPMFDRMDADGDGVITAEEMQAMRDRRCDCAMGDCPRRGGGPGPR